MKRFLLSLLLFSFLLGSLSADIYRSNCIGQKLEKEEALTDTGYELVLEEEESLLLDGVAVWTKSYFENGYEKVEGDTSELVYLEEERPVRRILTTPDHTEEYNYFYEGKLLSSYNYSLDGEVVRKCDYIRTTEGRLAGYQEDEAHYYLSSDFYVYSTEGNSLKLTDSSELSKSDEDNNLVRNEDGGYTEVVGSKTRTFNGEGRLVLEEDGESKTEYFYLDTGLLHLVRKTNDKAIILTEYEKGRVGLTTEYGLDGVIRNTRETLKDGTIEEIRYVDGSPRYQFHFDRDGRRIIGATGL